MWGCVCLHTDYAQHTVFPVPLLCLCSDSTDGLNAANRTEQRSCLKQVQEHVQASYSKGTSGNRFLHRANRDGQDCPGEGSLMQRPGGHESKCCEEKGKTSVGIVGKTRRKGFI